MTHVLGIILLVVGAAAYLAAIVSALRRVYQQYDRALRGAGLYVQAALAAAARTWPALIALAAGAALLLWNQ